MADGQAAAAPNAVRLCDGAELAERGRAQLFDVLHFGRPARGFALRHGGRVVAYLNRCAHLPTAMDCNEGEFLDATGTVIVCPLHGAVYAPADGRCLGGPCDGARPTPLAVEERGDGVYWYPSRDTLPVAGIRPAGPESTA